AERQPGTGEHATHERPLGREVGGGVGGMFVGELELQAAVFIGEGAIRTEGVSKCEPLAPEVAARFRQMQAECALREVMGDAGSMRRVGPAVRKERRE